MVVARVHSGMSQAQISEFVSSFPEGTQVLILRG
jgi:pantothenate kinase-related protein Tda10